MIIYTNKTHKVNVDGKDYIRISIESDWPNDTVTVGVPIEDFANDVNKYLDVIKSEFARLIRRYNKCSDTTCVGGEEYSIDDSNYEDVRNEIVNMKF